MTDKNERVTLPETTRRHAHLMNGYFSKADAALDFAAAQLYGSVTMENYMAFSSTTREL